MQPFEKSGMFYLGKVNDQQQGKDNFFLYASKHLTTHAVCLGMTGSGKTGLGIAILEEAALNSIPAIVIDPKGDMGNLLLAFPDLSAQEFKPWIDEGEAERKRVSLDVYAKEVAAAWKTGLEDWGETGQRIADFTNRSIREIYTPASRAGVPLSILSSFEAPSKEEALDTDAMREKILSTTSSLLGLLGLDIDPVKSREHILVSTIIAKSWEEGKGITLSDLIQQVRNPSFNKIGVLDLDDFFPLKERTALSIKLNNLLASPGFQAWLEGAPLNIEQLLFTQESKPKISIISIAHLNDSERMFFVTLFLNQLMSWMRKQPGTSGLRALFYMDEIFGYFPPVAAPPSKAPMISLLKQARAYGLGIVLSTQNPVDLDYKGLSNCGTWFIGRLQTARDQARVMEGLAAASLETAHSKQQQLSQLGKRVFMMYSIYEKEPVIFQTRWTLCYLRGPLTLEQIKLLTKGFKKEPAAIGNEQQSLDNSDTRPLVPQDFPQYFIPPSHLAPSFLYHPCIAGFAKLHFVDKKARIDEWIDSCVTIEDLQNLQWEEAKSNLVLKQQLAREPMETASYQPLPQNLLKKGVNHDLKQQLAAYLYQNSVLKMFEYKELKLLSSPQESEADFRQKVALALKERQDECVQKVRGDYEKKIGVLKEKIRKAEEKKDVQQQQSFYQKCEAFLSMFTAMIGAFFGRKVNKTTINQAGTAFRRFGRMGKEAQDVANAEENVHALQQQLQDATHQLDEEMKTLRIPIEANSLKLEEVVVRPRKTDIAIEEVALVWRPQS